MLRARRLLLTIFLIMGGLVAFPAAASSPPANDNIESAQVIADLPHSINVDMTDATRELTEPDLSYCSEEARTIWYKYTPAQDQTLGFLSSTHWGTVALFTGPGMPAVRAGCSYFDNDYPGSMNLTGGLEYFIQIGVWDSGVLEMQLYLPGSISGVVSDPDGQPFEFACVDSSPFGFGYTGPGGAYSIVGLPPGDYTVSFFDCYSGRYIGEYYDDAPTRSEATPVPVVSGGATTNINASLALGGSIVGNVAAPEVTDGSGEICILAKGSIPDNYAWGYVAQDGAYEVVGLPTDTYKVKFEPCFTSSLVAEWYQDRPDEASADPVEVTQGSTTTLDDVQLSNSPLPANDLRENAEPISSYPFTAQMHPASTGRESSPSSSCGTSPRRNVWYSIEVQEATTLVAEVSGDLDSFVSIWSVGPTGAPSEESCMTASAGEVASAAILAEPGQSYLVEVGAIGYYYGGFPGSVNLHIDRTTGGETVELESSVPCAAACPYWHPTMTVEDEREASCAPEPNSPAGSWADIEVTVPGSVGGKTPSHIAFTLEPELDWDSFLCRKTPNAAGKYYVASDANPVGAPCPTAVIAGCLEAVTTKVSVGEVYVLRAYNWGDVEKVKATYSFKVR